MKTTFIAKEGNDAKFTMVFTGEEFENAVVNAYKNNKDRFEIKGFRKGKAPRKMIENTYGEDIFYDEALNDLLQSGYPAALSELELEVIDQPRLNLGELKKGEDVEITATVACFPEVEAKDYFGLEVEKIEHEVTDEDIQKELERVQKAHSSMETVTDRKTEEGDTVVLDFDGSVDGVPFAGGKAENYTLTIGSGSFIPGFEDQLIGTKIGEDKDVTVTFPEDYHEKSLAGKEAVFKCKVNAITVKELPDADDEFASEVSEFETLAEYKEDIKKKLTEKKEKEARAKKEAQAVEKAVENATMEIPDAMIDTQVQSMMEDFARRMQSQGLSLEQYFQFTGMDAKKMHDQMKPEALKRIQNSLVLEAVAKAENIEISDEKVDEEIAKMAEAYKMEVEKLKGIIGDSERDQMKKDLAVQAAADLIADAAKEA